MIGGGMDTKTVAKYSDELNQAAGKEVDPVESRILFSRRTQAVETRKVAINEMVRDHEEETDKLVEVTIGNYRAYRKHCGQGDGSVEDLREAISHQKEIVSQLEFALSTAQEKLSEVRELASGVKNGE